MSLKDKASKINFASLITQHAAVPDAKQPKTAPGAMMAFANDSRSDLLREMDELRGQVGRVEELEARLGEAVTVSRCGMAAGTRQQRRLGTGALRLRSAATCRHRSPGIAGAGCDGHRPVGEAAPS